jgi:asparagine synthase (glutamine-hydrolysing)
VNFTSEDAARFAEKTIYHTEIPITNPLAVAKLCLSRFAREKDFIVSLSGEGSDELFLDYSSFRLEILLEMRSCGEAQVIMAEPLAEKLSDKDTTLPGTISKGTPR